jgi:Nicotianamine synthase protein
MLTVIQQFSVETYIDHVRRVHDFLTGQTDLSPRNPVVNAVLYGFVHDTMKGRSPEEVEAILSTAAIREIAPSLRQLLGRAEYEMECFCARAMIGDATGTEGRFSSYGHFIYRGNYEALVAAELHALEWHVKAPPIKPECESVAFVGAGPLPISAIMFHERTGLHVTCIDSDETASALGQQLVLHLAATEPRYKSLDKAIHFVHKPGEEHDYATHPIVFIASLVEKKVPVVMRIVQTSDTVATTVIRSAEGLSTLLYKPEDCVGGQEEYNVYLTGKTTSSSEAINTSLIYKFPTGKSWAQKQN